MTSFLQKEENKEKFGLGESNLFNQILINVLCKHNLCNKGQDQSSAYNSLNTLVMERSPKFPGLSVLWSEKWFASNLVFLEEKGETLKVIGEALNIQIRRNGLRGAPSIACLESVGRKLAAWVSCMPAVPMTSWRPGYGSKVKGFSRYFWI